MPKIERVIAADGSRKYRFASDDSVTFEAAFFHVAGRDRPNIACISTQLGCATGCIMCSAANIRFSRNLTADELVLQVANVLKDHDERALLEEGFEVSFMGLGEPLANLPNIIATLAVLHHSYPQITRVSISTAGPSSRIDALTASMPMKPPVHLQLSLHATSEETRTRLIPKAPDRIDRLLAAAGRYHEKTGDVVCLNYVLLPGINDSTQDLDWLLQNVDRTVFYVKLSLLNHVDGMPAFMIQPTIAELKRFANILNERGVMTRVFVGDGLDAQASCGQLAATPREVPLVFHA